MAWNEVGGTVMEFLSEERLHKLTTKRLLALHRSVRQKMRGTVAFWYRDDQDKLTEYRYFIKKILYTRRGNMLNEAELKEIHKLCNNHRAALEKSNLCGCFYCRQTFKPSEIYEWVDYEDTALCPKCGIDSVLALDDTMDNTAMLLDMSMYWFNLDYDEDGNLVHKLEEQTCDGRKKT